MYLFKEAIDARATNHEKRRQGFLVMVVSAAVGLLSLSLFLYILLNSRAGYGIIITLVAAIISLGCVVLARYGFARPAAYVLTGMASLGTIVFLLLDPSPVGVFFLAIPILLAGIVLSSIEILPVALLGLVVAILVAPNNNNPTLNFFSGIVFVITVTALSYLGAWGVERALRSADAASNELEKANQKLNETNTDLEAHVAQRTADLQQALESLKQRESQLKQTLSELQTSQDTLRELSAPILPVAPGVLVAPAVGAIDSSRATLLVNNLLTTTERESARYLIIDVTGVPIIDTQVAKVLLHSAQAVKLIGAQVILTGIRPEVAQTLVGLGVNLGEIVTKSTLESGVAEAIRRMQATTSTSSSRA